MTVYMAAFSRLSRNHNVPPAMFTADNADALAEAIWGFARQHCLSRDLSVRVDLDEMRGKVFAGFQVAGEFTLEVMSP